MAQVFPVGSNLPEFTKAIISPPNHQKNQPPQSATNLLWITSNTGGNMHGRGTPPALFLTNAIIEYFLTYIDSGSDVQLLHNDWSDIVWNYNKHTETPLVVTLLFATNLDCQLIWIAFEFDLVKSQLNVKFIFRMLDGKENKICPDQASIEC